MSRATIDLWQLIRATPKIDAQSLAHAVEDAVDHADDFRTRVLIRDSISAIKSYWGEQRLNRWLANTPNGGRIQTICESMSREATDEHGFPSLKRRIVDSIDPENIFQFLRDLSQHVLQPTRLVIGGAIALMMTGHLQRQTEDIDIVDEVPEHLRTQYKVLEELNDRYGLQLTHFQSHYLPSGWEKRIQLFATYGSLQVFTIDLYDLFLTKLFSVRAKDKDDLRVLQPQLDRNLLETRFHETTVAFLTEPKLRDAAKTNWYVLFGEELPK